MAVPQVVPHRQSVRFARRPLWLESFRGLVRLAVAEGLPCAVDELERIRDMRVVEAASAGASRLYRVRGTRKRPGRGRPRNVLDPNRAVSALLDYGRAARAAQPDMPEDDLDATLRLHAQVIGVAADDVEDVVADVLVQMLDQ